MLDLMANLAIPVIMLIIIVYGKYKKVDVFESFITGAIDGLKTALNILPYIIGIFIAIGIFILFLEACKFLKIPYNLIWTYLNCPLKT